MLHLWLLLQPEISHLPPENSLEREIIISVYNLKTLNRHCIFRSLVHLIIFLQYQEESQRFLIKQYDLNCILTEVPYLYNLILYMKQKRRNINLSTTYVNDFHDYNNLPRMYLQAWYGWWDCDSDNIVASASAGFMCICQKGNKYVVIHFVSAIYINTKIS